MKYIGSDFTHGTAPCTGVLLLNTGTPAAPTAAAVRAYLKQFLSDPRVIEAGWWWPLVLHGIILRVRPARSAKLYRSVWTDKGSPLLDISRRQASALQRMLSDRAPGPVRVALGMRYGEPSIPAALESLRKMNARRLLVLPLFPQYSATTVASCFDEVARVLRTWRWQPELRTVAHYHDEPDYIRALATSVQQLWNKSGPADRLLFTFHGLPKRYFDAGDPYFCECHKTARLVAEALQLPEARWKVAFQSRVGFDEWLKPYTNDVLKEWGKAGQNRVDVIAPGFSSDCLETLEEIDHTYRQLFLKAGGNNYRYIPALNDRPEHLQFLANLVRRHTQGWAEFASDWSAAKSKTDLDQSAAQARRLGAGH